MRGFSYPGHKGQTSRLALPGLNPYQKTGPLGPGVWCEEGDLNPHALRHQILSLACLPIPPSSRAQDEDTGATEP